MKENTKAVISFRLSNECLTLIDKQKGDNRSAKFENLVVRSSNEIKSREQRVKELDALIAAKEKELQKTVNRIDKARAIAYDVETINNTFQRIYNTVEKFEKGER